MTESPHTIYTSPLVVPVTAEPIIDGAVAVDDHCIIEVGPKGTLLERWPQAGTEELSGLLMPPLVNCHMHLELAAFVDIPRPQQGEAMIEWITALIAKRSRNPGPAGNADASQQSLREQYLSGVALIADICNTLSGEGFEGEGQPEVYRLHEIIAPTASRSDEMLRQLECIPQFIPACAHAPYSTAAKLIVALKRRARHNGHVFSLHVAESADEQQFLKSGSGPFRDFLEQRGSWDGSILGGGGYDGSIFYLDRLGVLDARTLCVHCVHVSEAEITVLAARRAKVCLCPGSNEFLGVGTAPLEPMLEAGLLPAIGTDSRASNEETDMWREIALLRRHHPSVAASTLIAMATYGGAAALGRAGDYGSLERGKKPLMLEIEIEFGDKEAAEDVLERLVCGRRPHTIRWRAPLPGRSGIYT